MLSMDSPHQDYFRDLVQAIRPPGMDTPPRDVLWAVATLSSLTVPPVAILTRESVGDSTTWRFLGLTEAHLLEVEATAAVANWNYGNEVDAETVTATAHPRAAVASVSVVEFENASTWGGSEHNRWFASWRLKLTDGRAIDVPNDKASQKNAEALGLALLNG